MTSFLHNLTQCLGALASVPVANLAVFFLGATTLGVLWLCVLFLRRGVK